MAREYQLVLKTHLQKHVPFYKMKQGSAIQNKLHLRVLECGIYLSAPKEMIPTRLALTSPAFFDRSIMVSVFR
jgi:hypothetical protein